MQLICVFKTSIMFLNQYNNIQKHMKEIASKTFNRKQTTQNYSNFAFKKS